MYQKSSRTAPLIFTSIQDKTQKYLFFKSKNHTSSVEAFLLNHIQIHQQQRLYPLTKITKQYCNTGKKREAFILSYTTLDTLFQFLFRNDAWQEEESQQAFAGREDCLLRAVSIHFIALLLSGGFLWYTSPCSGNDWNNITTTARTKPSAVSATTDITVVVNRANTIAAPAAAHPSTL